MTRYRRPGDWIPSFLAWRTKMQNAAIRPKKSAKAMQAAKQPARQIAAPPPYALRLFLAVQRDRLASNSSHLIFD